MARFKKIPQVKEGKIVFCDGIVDSIVLLAVKEIPMAELCADLPSRQMRSSAIKVKIEKDGVHVDVAIKIHYTQSVSDVAFKIQEAVRHNVEAMTEYHVANVNVIIRGISFEDLSSKTSQENGTTEIVNNTDGTVSSADSVKTDSVVSEDKDTEIKSDESINASQTEIPAEMPVEESK